MLSLSIANLSATGGLQLERLLQDNNSDPFEPTYYNFHGEVMNGRYGLLIITDFMPSDGNSFILSDGTPEGTQTIEIYGDKSLIADLGDYLLISSFDYANGEVYDLWVTDGTDEGTVALVQGVETFLYLGGTSEGFLYLLPTPEGGTALWKSAGTAETTKLLLDLSNGNPSSENRYGAGYQHTITEINGHYLFPIPAGEEGAELWTTDGTVEGTEKIALIETFGRFWSIGSAGKTDDYALVSSTNVSKEGNEIIWVTDGTAAGTQELLTGIVPGEIYRIGDVLIFDARDFGDFTGVNYPTLRTDGTPEGTYTLEAGGLGHFLDGDLYALEDKIIFVHAQKLWVTDGTQEGTELLKDLDPDNDGGYPGVFEGIDEYVFFGISDGEEQTTWVTDGTVSGTRSLGEVSVSGVSADVNEPVFVNGRYILGLDDGIHGRELWATDLTAAGTVLLADTIPGSDGNEGTTHVAGSRFAYFTSFNAERGSSGGFSLWRTDGTPAGTKRIKQIVEEGISSSHSVLGAIGANLVFRIAIDGIDSQLWVSDGTARGTRPLTAIQHEEPLFDARGGLGISKLGESATGQFIRVTNSESQDGIYFLSAVDADSPSPDTAFQGAYVNETTRFSEWYGWFFITTPDNPWIYHLKLGFIYASGTDSQSIWYYSVRDGWQWTSNSVYPWQYMSDENAWAYFYLSSVGAVWVYHADTGEWEYRPSENESF